MSLTRIAFIVGLVLISNAGSALACDFAKVQESAKKIAAYQIQKDLLARPVIGIKLQAQPVVVLNPQLQSADVGEAVAEVEVEVVATTEAGLLAVETARIKLKVFNDEVHACEVRVYSKSIVSSYELCREIKGYNGRSGNPYDPCVE